jgi:Permuted papain-like amidase enzyme, YaeF/YiiX, C92 family
MTRLLRATAIATTIFSAIVYAWLSLTTVSAKDLPSLKNGDIIFQTSRSSQSSAILLASMSAYSHMGIIELGSDGAPFVLEAVGPVKPTPLDAWIKRGLGGRVAIKRLPTLTPDQSQSILQAAHKFDDLPYDLFFMSTTDQIYCSELISLAFKNGASLTLGKTQKAKELYLNNFAAKRLISKRWQKHPLCQSAQTANFESCYAQILEQELVTPDSIYNDPKLDLIYSNYRLIP